MRTTYRGHEIEVTREESMAGEMMIFWSIFRAADGFECDSGFSSSAEGVRPTVKYLKQRVDNELLEGDPWSERP